MLSDMRVVLDLPDICFMPVSCLNYCLALKLEAKCSSEASIEFQQRYIAFFTVLELIETS
jgi:hypothetical protein